MQHCFRLCLNDGEPAVQGSLIHIRLVESGLLQHSGVIRPCFSDDGNTPVLKDMFASLTMSGAITPTVVLSMVVGIKSTGDDLVDIERISRSTSLNVTPGRLSSRHGSRGHVCLGLQVVRCRIDETPEQSTDAWRLSAILRSLSVKN